MKTLLPIERLRSDGTIRNWTATAVAISCFPVVSAPTDGHKGSGNGPASASRGRNPRLTFKFNHP
jgi:hypothetical protein